MTIVSASFMNLSTSLDQFDEKRRRSMWIKRDAITVFIRRIDHFVVVSIEFKKPSIEHVTQKDRCVAHLDFLSYLAFSASQRQMAQAIRGQICGNSPPMKRSSTYIRA